jgi:hypothetical protein
MSLFGFGDIVFSPSTGGAKGPFAPLVNSEFKQQSLKYPLDLGNYDKAHYMVFYVKQQKNSSYRGDTVSESLINGPTAPLNTVSGIINSTPLKQTYAGGLLTSVNNTINNITGEVQGIVGSVKNLFGGASNVLGGTNAATKTVLETSIQRISGGSLSAFRTTELTKESIALYMPDTLFFTQSQTYDQLNLGGELTGQALAAATSALDALEKGGAEQGFSALKKSALRTALERAVTKTGSQTLGIGAAALTGVVVNPMLEMIYRSPNFRNFQFDFMFYPRDEKEANQVQKIIKSFEFHQAPEINQTLQGFLIPPSQFDIRFYYGGRENPNIPSIASCVLTNIQVNYAPNGFSAFEVPNENTPSVGRTGMPVAIQLTLSFQETTFLTKDDYVRKGSVEVGNMMFESTVGGEGE